MMEGENIILMGMKHCGKSTLGKMLGRVTGLRYFDLDVLMEELYENRSATVREIYKERGKNYFQQLETRAVQHLLRQTRFGEPIAAALGGGTIENSQAMDSLGKDWLFVYLQAPPDILFQRIRQSGLPPFLEGPDPYSAFLELYHLRTELYQQAADLIIEIGTQDLKDSLNTLITSLKGIGYAW